MAYIYMLLSLAITCYDEAGGQGHDAMQFVADTVINRVHSDKFPNTVEGVIYQRGQFAWVGRNRHHTVEDLKRVEKKMVSRKDPHRNNPEIWVEAVQIAGKSLAHDFKPKTHSLYFSSHTIKAHSKVKYSYRHTSKHKH